MTLALPQLRPGFLRKGASHSRRKIPSGCTRPETVHSLRQRTAFRTSAQSPDDTGSSQGSRARPSHTNSQGPSWLDFSRGIPDLLSADEETETAREKFWGKLAVLILGAVLAGERVTGEGFVGALDHDVGIPFWEAEPFIGFIVLFLLALGVYPSRTRLLHFRQRTRANIYAGFQRLVGRLACLTLAGTILLEVITGKGMLKLLNIETGLERLSEVEFGVAFLLILFLTEEPKDMGTLDD